MASSPAASIALVYPPSCDPTAPYLAVPMLTGFLRANGVGVLPIDANIEAYDDLLTPERLGRERNALETALAAFDAKSTLTHDEQLRYLALARARGAAHAVPGGIAEAKDILRDEARFFDPDAYASAVATIDASLRVVSATHAPLHLDFTAYRTPLGLTSMAEVARAAEPDMNPFHDYVEHTLIPRLRASGVKIIGISVCFPGQLQPAYAFATQIKRALPDVHLTCGGPGVTQMLIRLSGQRLARALGPFDSAVVFEGEHTLLSLVRALEEPGDPKARLKALTNVVIRDRLMGARWLSAHGMEDLKALPAPDFDGLPLERYLSPQVVLPYDPTRGCYWGKCTFCHYGLAEVGTASYREREVSAMLSHLASLKEKHGTPYFYFSQDSVAPKTLVKLSEALIGADLSLRWATDLKPEKYLTQERAQTLRDAGAVACALGVESGSDRVLKLIDKGAPVSVVSDVIDRLATAGIAAEAMCFTDFPTESHAEAMQTLDMLHERHEQVAVYIVGEFGLTHGSLVAQSPERFGITETWELDGDELGLGIFFEPKTPWKTDDERADVDDALSELSEGWLLRTYPWAGAVSTAHSILHYDKLGPTVLKDLAERGTNDAVLGDAPLHRTLSYPLVRLADAEQREAMIWHTLVHEQRHVSRAAYEALAAEQPAVKPKPGEYEFRADAPPRPMGGAKKAAKGRRPSHASNSAR